MIELIEGSFNALKVFCLFYRPQMKFAKVMFLHLSIILFTGGGVWQGGVHGREGMHGRVCVCGRGSMCGNGVACMVDGHVWWGACMPHMCPPPTL